MISLAELQRSFAQALRRPDAALPAALTDSIAREGMTTQRRVGVYRANVLGGRIRVLEKIFPVCRKVVGDTCFGALARGCALEYASPARDPEAVGTGFPNWLDRMVAATESLREVAYLPDLARLELARHRAWTAPDDNRFDFAAFQDSVHRHPPKQHRLLAPGSLTLQVSDWPVDRIWEANQTDDATAVAGEDGRAHIAVLRRAQEVGHVRIPIALYRALEAVVSGVTLGELDAVAMSAGTDLNSLLPRLVTGGYITDFRL